MEEGNSNSIETELVALESIYVNELTVSRQDDGYVEKIEVLINPATGHDTSKQYVCMTLVFTLGAQYPVQIPEIEIKNPRGIGEEEVASLVEAMIIKAEELKGEVMLYTLIEIAKDSLTEGNIPHCPCVVCLEHFNQDDSFHRTGCYHYFHTSCLYKYVRHTRAQLEEERKEAMERRHIESSILEKDQAVVCPLCRAALDDSLLLVHCSEDVTKEESPNVFIISPEMREMQRKMAEIYERQKAKGGIIDLDEEKNKYLVNADSRTVFAVPEQTQEVDNKKKNVDNISSGGDLKNKKINLKKNQNAQKFSSQKPCSQRKQELKKAVGKVDKVRAVEKVDVPLTETKPKSNQQTVSANANEGSRKTCDIFGICDANCDCCSVQRLTDSVVQPHQASNILMDALEHEMVRETPVARDSGLEMSTKAAPEIVAHPKALNTVIPTRHTVQESGKMLEHCKSMGASAWSSKSHRSHQNSHHYHHQIHHLHHSHHQHHHTRGHHTSQGQARERRPHQENTSRETTFGSVQDGKGGNAPSWNKEEKSSDINANQNASSDKSDKKSKITFHLDGINIQHNGQPAADDKMDDIDDAVLGQGLSDNKENSCFKNTNDASCPDDVKEYYVGYGAGGDGEENWEEEVDPYSYQRFYFRGQKLKEYDEMRKKDVKYFEEKLKERVITKALIREEFDRMEKESAKDKCLPESENFNIEAKHNPYPQQVDPTTKARNAKMDRYHTARIQSTQSKEKLGMFTESDIRFKLCKESDKSTRCRQPPVEEKLSKQVTLSNIETPDNLPANSSLGIASFISCSEGSTELPTPDELLKVKHTYNDTTIDEMLKVKHAYTDTKRKHFLKKTSPLLIPKKTKQNINVHIMPHPGNPLATRKPGRPPPLNLRGKKQSPEATGLLSDVKAIVQETQRINPPGIIKANEITQVCSQLSSLMNILPSCASLNLGQLAVQPTSDNLPHPFLTGSRH